VARTSPHHGGDALGDSAISDTEEVLVGSWPGVARVGEIGAPPTLGEPRAPFGLDGFGEFGAILLA
jgi:hypothetical protein